MADAPEPTPTMRLDRFLWWSRLAKTRGVAQALAESGSFRLNGRRIERAASAVRPGDTLTFMGADRHVRVVQVAALPVRRGPAPEARACYSEPTANVSQEGADD